MSVTIASFTFDYSGSGGTCTIRWYADSDFLDPDGVYHPAQAAGGSSYLKSVTCSVASNVATVPTFTLPATWDEASGARSSLTAYVFNSAGQRVGNPLVSNFRIPTLPATTTWGALLTYNDDAASIRGTNTYTKQQTNYQIEQAALAGGPASTTALGRVKMSVAPVDPAGPIAVGDNDPRVAAQTNVAYYEGTGNAAVDTPGLQAAIDSVAVAGGKVKVSGTCLINQTILLTSRGAGGTEAYVSLEGDNPITTKLVWVGSTSGRLLEVTYNKFSTISRLGFVNGVAKGTTIGILLTGPNTSGTQTLGMRVELVLVQGFDKGIYGGVYTGKATSEMKFSTLYLQGNNTGYFQQDLNSLDLGFDMLMMSGNGVGLDISSGNVYVHGGSASFNSVADFALSNAGTPSSLRDFRSETANRFLTINASASAHTVTVENCLVQAISNPDNIAIDAGGNVQLKISRSSILAKVRMGLDLGSVLEMRGNYVAGDTLVPFFVDTSGADALGLKYVVEGNKNYPSDFFYPDETGQYVGINRVPVLVVNKVTALSPPFATLNRVRMLAQGSEAAGKNLRGQEKFAGAATKAVTFTRNVTVSTSAGSTAVGFVAGTINIGDVGRKIVLAAAGAAGVDVTGYIKSVDSPTSMTIVGTSLSGIQVTSGSIVATIGEDEPDANFIISLSCDAQEKISWSGKSSSGFTLTSDNATSTATVDWMLVR